MFKVKDKILSINGYVGEVIIVTKHKVTVFYKKDNSTEDFLEHQFSSLNYMKEKYDKNN